MRLPLAARAHFWACPLAAEVELPAIVFDKMGGAGPPQAGGLLRRLFVHFGGRPSLIGGALLSSYCLQNVDEQLSIAPVDPGLS